MDTTTPVALSTRPVSPRFSVVGPASATAPDALHIYELRETGTDVVLGSAHVARAEATFAADAVPSGQQGLRTALALKRFTLSPGAPRGAAAALAYAALRGGRVLGRTAVVSSADVGAGIHDLLGLTPIAGSKGLLGGRLDIALHKAAARAEAEGEAPLPGFLVTEITDTLDEFIHRVRAGGFFGAVLEGALTREQYIHVLSQTHQYVRYTTRILGFCVAYAQTPALREHFIRHLREEVNHEQIIERDLAHLGADPAYVRDVMAPNAATNHFILAELALVAYHHDPVLLTAAPLAAEGITAHLSQEFIRRLDGLVESWGIREPGKATRFFTSHVGFDGGDDGHLAGSMRLLEGYAVNEKRLSEYLSAFGVCRESLLGCYTAAMEEVALWAVRR